MTTELPKDPEGAAKLLASLEEKDQQATTCRYPTCYETPVAFTGTGRPSAYCASHTAVQNHRARTALRVLAVAVDAPKSVAHEQPAGVVPAENLRTSIVNRITLLQSDLERYLATLIQLADPDLSAAQMKAVLDQAEARVAEAQQIASTERSLRLAAETVRTAALEEVHAEREAAEQAIERMEAAENAREQERAEAQRHLAEVEAEYAKSLEGLRAEAKAQQEQLEQQAQVAIEEARAAMIVAQEDAKEAEIRAQQARAQATTSEQLLHEAQTALERERKEIDRLRKEHAEVLADLRVQRETDRAEARTMLERERKEIDRLREELAATRQQAEHATSRAEALATINDDLRRQLVQVQVAQQQVKL